MRASHSFIPSFPPFISSNFKIDSPLAPHFSLLTHTHSLSLSHFPFFTKKKRKRKEKIKKYKRNVTLPAPSLFHDTLWPELQLASTLRFVLRPCSRTTAMGCFFACFRARDTSAAATTATVPSSRSSKRKPNVTNHWSLLFYFLMSTFRYFVRFAEAKLEASLNSSADFF